MTLFYVTCEFIAHLYEILNGELERLSRTLKLKSRNKSNKSVVHAYHDLIDKLDLLTLLNEKTVTLLRKSLSLFGLTVAFIYLSTTTTFVAMVK